MSTSALSQSRCDSLDCFTKEQTKVFLRTKVLLDNCNLEYSKLHNDHLQLKAKNEELEETVEKKQKKIKRNRIWGGISSGVAILVSGLLFIK